MRCRFIPQCTPAPGAASSIIVRARTFAAKLSLGSIASLGLLAAASTPPAHNARLDTVLQAVEQRYNRAQTLTARFTETYESGNRTRRSESGTLALRKPGRMRWDYSSPTGKMFLSDGKRFYLYNPDTQRVEVSSAKDLEDMHAPLAFLLGKLHFYKEFSGFEMRGDGPDLWIEAEPTSATLPYSKVEFLVTPEARIRRLRVTQDDLSVLDFTFEDEALNARLAPDRFVFRMPAGAEIDDTSR